jgi:hypothetical protein
MRLLGGLVVQPVLAGGLAFLLFPFLLLDSDGQTLGGGYPSNPTDAALSVALGAGIVAGLVTLVAVLPTIWLMQRRQLTFKDALLFGVAFGNAPYVLLAALTRGTYGIPGLLRGIAFSSLLGLCGAALFWLIVLRWRVPRSSVGG